MIGLPATVLAKPHCGLSASRSRVDVLRRLVDAPPELIDRLERAHLGAHQAEHDALPLRHEAQRREIAGAGRVVLEQEVVDVGLLEEAFCHGLVAAVGEVQPLEVAAAHVHADDDGRGPAR